MEFLTCIRGAEVPLWTRSAWHLLTGNSNMQDVQKLVTAREEEEDHLTVQDVVYKSINRHKYFCVFHIQKRQCVDSHYSAFTRISARTS